VSWNILAVLSSQLDCLGTRRLGIVPVRALRGGSRIVSGLLGNIRCAFVGSSATWNIWAPAMRRRSRLGPAICLYGGGGASVPASGRWGRPALRFRCFRFFCAAAFVALAVLGAGVAALVSSGLRLLSWSCLRLSSLAFWVVLGYTLCVCLLWCLAFGAFRLGVSCGRLLLWLRFSCSRRLCCWRRCRFLLCFLR
jgi:hypothetical protein